MKVANMTVIAISQGLTLGNSVSLPGVAWEFADTTVMTPRAWNKVCGEDIKTLRQRTDIPGDDF
jgi:hypothetical protein